MQPRCESYSQRPFIEYLGLYDQITGMSSGRRNQEERTSRARFPSKIDQSPVTGKITHLRISKSLIRQLIYNGEPYPVCPYKVYRTALLRDIIIPATDSQIKGLYFETRCLGLSADGSATVDLPRHKKTGGKLADHERIDQAVELFFKVKSEYGMNPDKCGVQLYGKVPWREPQHEFPIKIFLDGTLDFITPIKTPGYWYDRATIDLKLTKDRDVLETYTNGLFHSTPWGNMETADFTEAMVYRLIFGLPFIYLVFDYRKDNPGFKDILVITDVNDPDPRKAEKAQTRMSSLRFAIRYVVNSILQWERSGWPMCPIPKVCLSCPIMDCPKRNEAVEV
jgi:hypothetical protein